MKCLKSDKDSLEKVAALLKEGKVLILPTDTVYGFSGIIEKTDSLIRKIKGRGEDKPFIVLISNPKEIENITAEKIPETLEKFWPGPLTVIVKEKNNPLKTVAVRCPGDEWLRNVISECGRPIYSTSVNRSGKPVLTKEVDILEEFEEEVSLVVLDGDSKSSVPSTIVRLSRKNKNGFEVVREGALKIN